MAKARSRFPLRAGNATEVTLSATSIFLEGNEGNEAVIVFSDRVQMRVKVDVRQRIFEGFILTKQGQEIFKMIIQRTLFSVVFADMPQKMAAAYWLAADSYLRDHWDKHPALQTNPLYCAVYNSVCYDPVGALVALDSGSAPVQASTW